MDSPITIRPVETKDYPFILALNEANVEVLAPMGERDIENFTKWAELFQVAEVDGKPAAFLIALREGQDYTSENYRWFAAKYPHFLYVDRIVIDQSYRKHGIGRIFYTGVKQHAQSIGVPVVTAEIDLEPIYNAASLRFHAAMGFREVGTQYVRGGTVKVSLQAADIAAQEHFHIIRATKTAEQAGAYYVRLQAMQKKYHIPLEAEFDEHDTPQTKYIVILDDIFPVATCRLYPIDRESVMLGRIVVLPEYRGRGLGKKAVLAAEDWARELGFGKSVLESRVERTGFYEKLGYTADRSRQIHGETFDCIYMDKVL